MAGFAAHEERVEVGAPERPDLAASIRPARNSELDEIAGLFAPALAPYRGGVQDWILDAYLAELVDVRPRFEEAEVLVAEHDECIVGTIAFYPDVRLEGWSNLPAGWAGFRALAVAPRRRGTGIGQALVRRCIQRTREIGAETLGIHTISLLSDAVSLYQRLGFVRCPEFDMRAADVFTSDNADDMVGLALRRDVESPGTGRKS